MRTILTVAFLFCTVHSAFGYEVRRSSSGVPLRWGAGTIHVQLALEDGPDGTSPGEARAAAAGAFYRYASAMAELTPEVAVAVGDGGNTATVRWVRDGWDDDFDPVALAVTVTNYDADSGRIDGANIVINAERYHWSTAAEPGPACGGYDLQDVLTHEIGHMFGLAHDPRHTDATMYPAADPCETNKRELHPPDLDGLRYLYVEVGPAPEGCSVAGRAPAGWAALPLLVGLVALRRRRAALLALLIAAPAHATIVRRLGLDEMGRGAALVVEGRVRATAVVEAGGRVYTDATLDVATCMKGTCPATLTVRQLGGELAGRGVAVEGAARLAEGGDVVLYLRPRRDGAFAVVGMAQGAFAVEKAGTLARDLRALGFAGERGHGALERIRREDLERALKREP